MPGRAARRPVDPRLARLLLAAAALGLCSSAVLGVAWLRARGGGPLTAESLGEADRRRLTRELLASSPGVFQTALADPAIGYTLRPDQPVEAWGSSFVANSLGYRAGPVDKAAGTLRVVFVGDSWAFGLGVDEAQAFPRQLEALVAAHGRSPRPVEAWSLALPGYNLLNEVAALATYSDQLRPDAVVFCPTVNDVNSSHTVLPNGSLGHAGQLVDDFGCPVPLELRSRVFDSHLYRARWRRAMAALAGVTARLEARGVPALVLFAGPWPPGLVRSLVGESGLDASYLVAPPELAGPPWVNPPPWGHPNPAAHQVHARLVYQALAPRLGWAELEPAVGEPTAAVEWRAAGDGSWRQDGDRALRENVGRQLQPRFVPGGGNTTQLVCGIDPATGAMGRTGALFLRREPDARRLSLQLRRCAEAPLAYPLEVTLTVPSAGGGATARLEVSASGPAEQAFSVELPPDLGDAVAVDVLLVAERVTVDASGLVPCSVAVVGVAQEP